MVRHFRFFWVAAAAWLLFFSAPTVVEAASPEAIGKVGALVGAVVAEGPGGKRTLQEGGAVYTSDSIATMAGANCRIDFTDNSTLSLDENSRVELTEYVYAPNQPSMSKAVLKLFKGLCRAVTGGIVKHNPQAYTLRTPLANFGIRGTEFYASIEPNGENLGVLAMDRGHTVEIWTKVDRLQIKEAGYFTRVSMDGKLSPLMQIPKNVTNQIMRVQQNMMRLKAAPPTMPHRR